MDDSQRRFCSNIVASIISERGIAIVNIPDSAIVAAQALKACESEYHRPCLMDRAKYVDQLIVCIENNDGSGTVELIEEMGPTMESRVWRDLNSHQKNEIRKLLQEGFRLMREKEGE